MDHIAAGRDARRMATLGLIGIAISTMTAVAACSSGTADNRSSGTRQSDVQTTTTSAATSATSPADVAKQQALSAYLGMWNDFVAAATTSDWRSPQLGQYATGLALSTLSRGLYADHYNGLVSRGAPTHTAHVTAMDPAGSPTTVNVVDCSDSTNALKYHADTGQPANDSPGGRRLINATVEKQSDGSWKVSDFGVQGVGTC